MYVCVNCNAKVQKLYKEYSASVLKLEQCTRCNSVADKYIEYDPVIIIIDLILLDKQAVRHTLFNTSFQNYWRLAIILLFMEVFSERVKLFYNTFPSKLISEINIFQEFNFYMLCLQIFIAQVAFVCTVHLLSIHTQSNNPGLLYTWKCLTLSAFGRLFHLPALIWGNVSITETHHIFVLIYTIITHFLTYSILFNCSKLKSLLIISLAFIVRLLFLNYLITTK